MIHQYCLAHLNKLIVADFPNNTNIEQELIDSFEKHVQKRLRKIEKNWQHFTAFYFVNGAPATNNGVENYYSTSLKTHRKKQIRTDKGIENQMKLSAYVL